MYICAVAQFDPFCSGQLLRSTDIRQKMILEVEGPFCFCPVPTFWIWGTFFQQGRKTHKIWALFTVHERKPVVRGKYELVLSRPLKFETGPLTSQRNFPRKNLKKCWDKFAAKWWKNIAWGACYSWALEGCIIISLLLLGIFQICSHKKLFDSLKC